MKSTILDYFHRVKNVNNAQSNDIQTNVNQPNSNQANNIQHNDIQPVCENNSKVITKKLIQNDKENQENEPEYTNDDDDDDSFPKSKGYKRIRCISDGEDNDKENKTQVPVAKKYKTSKLTEETDLNNSFSSVTKSRTESTPKKAKKTNKNEKKLQANTKALLSSFSKTANDSISELNGSQLATVEPINTGTNHNHDSYEFLKIENIRDKHRRKSDHPDYDANSLFLPDNFKSSLTPAMKQWWAIKADGNMDTIIFFKVGKFYELYHMDAVIAVKELGLTYMRGSGSAHSGFPEIAFAKMADQLVLKGYKVARVEQTESVEAMNERVKVEVNKNKVVHREVCQIVTPGTRGFSLTNKTCREVGQEGNEEMTYIEDAGGMLYAFKEAIIEDGSRCRSAYTTNIGVALVNTNTGKFTISQFADDDQRSRFRTMVSRFPPNEIIYLRGNLSKSTQHVFNTCLAATKKECLANSKQFLSSEDTLVRLLETGYFTETSSDKLSRFDLPIGLTDAISESDNLGRTAAREYELAVSCIGALIHFLERCLIDKYLVSVADFNIYTPTDGRGTASLVNSIDTPFYNYQRNMILDSNTLANLDILKNSTVGGTGGTLLERLDFSSTAFGRRLLIQWIATPLCDPKMIIERQEAVKDLIDMDVELSAIKSHLKLLPDLEKLIAKIHVLGLSKSVSKHPDSRAIMFESLIYSRRKIHDFVAALTGFDNVIRIQSEFSEIVAEHNIKSSLLKKIMLLLCDDEMGEFPDIKKTIEFFSRAFDKEKAKKDGKIIPENGVDLDYDEAITGVERVNQELDEYLEKQKKLLKCNITYFGTGRNRYQLEIPESKCANIPDVYVVSSQKKGFKRYTTPDTQSLLARLVTAEEKRDVALTNIMSKIFAKFDEDYLQWTKVISNVGQLDVLLSLAAFSRGIDGGPMTKPEIRQIVPNMKPYLVITEGRYPCKAKTQTGEFISNTIKLGSFLPNNPINIDQPVMLLTGPNMGGKSTLMRQTALIIILSQLGCYVPAEGPVILTPVDRLFTRQGANDNIGAGQSTLQVEMNEAGLILSYMSEHSFVLIDELGRGTATYDGCALAYAILKAISDNLGPRTIFSTHFHKLLEERDVTTSMQISHMACMVEDDDASVLDDNSKLQNITFLYKLTNGGCPKSYGFNAARLANIPEQIILNGLNKAHLFEEETLILEFKKYLSDKGNTVEDLKMWQQRFKKIYNK